MKRRVPIVTPNLEEEADDISLRILALAPEIRHCVGAAIVAAQGAGMGWRDFAAAVELQWAEHALTVAVLLNARAGLSKPPRGMT